MNYHRIYNAIINKRLDDPLTDGYFECHHILPRSLGGNDNKENLVNLTAREHFICHLLLTKMYKPYTIEWYKMAKAFGAMCWLASKNQTRYSNNKHYEWLRINFSKTQSMLQSGKNNSQFNKIWIHNVQLKKSRKISKYDTVPEGWQLGRIVNFNKTAKIKIDTRKIKEEEYRLLAQRLYDSYINGDFKSIREFCRLDNYKHSHVSLIRLWKKYIPGFAENVKKGRRFIRL